MIGIDFDNTIVCYDTLFHRVALERELIEPTLPQSKQAVRDHLRQTGREDHWTHLQGVVYGQRIEEASPFTGVIDFFAYCRDLDVNVCIVSHKTRYPVLGDRVDLHDAARRWLALHGLDGVTAYFEPTRDAKYARIAQCGCTHFVDDLPEFLLDHGFPQSTRRFWFNPKRVAGEDASLAELNDWSQAVAVLGLVQQDVA